MQLVFYNKILEKSQKCVRHHFQFQFKAVARNTCFIRFQFEAVAKNTCFIRFQFEAVVRNTCFFSVSVRGSCYDRVAETKSYFSNPSWPLADTSNSFCTYSLVVSDPDVCQIRFNLN